MRNGWRAPPRTGTVALVGCEFRWTTDEALAGRLIRGGAIGTPQVVTFVQHSSLVANGLPQAFRGLVAGHRPRRRHPQRGGRACHRPVPVMVR